jgi:hypothetical protein
MKTAAPYSPQIVLMLIVPAATFEKQGISELLTLIIQEGIPFFLPALSVSVQTRDLPEI